MPYLQLFDSFPRQAPKPAPSKPILSLPAHSAPSHQVYPLLIIRPTPELSKNFSSSLASLPVVNVPVPFPFNMSVLSTSFFRSSSSSFSPSLCETYDSEQHCPKLETGWLALRRMPEREGGTAMSRSYAWFVNRHEENEKEEQTEPEKSQKAGRIHLL